MLFCYSRKHGTASGCPPQCSIPQMVPEALTQLLRPPHLRFICHPDAQVGRDLQNPSPNLSPVQLAQGHPAFSASMAITRASSLLLFYFPNDRAITGPQQEKQLWTRRPSGQSQGFLVPVSEPLESRDVRGCQVGQGAGQAAWPAHAHARPGGAGVCQD